MLMPSDKDYKDTKQIMLGKAKMLEDFRELAVWITKEYGVNPVNIIYDTIDKGKRPRLQICFEYEMEALEFRSADKVNFDHPKQQAIAKQFERNLKKQGITKKRRFLDFLFPVKEKYSFENIWVYFSAFEPLAKIEVTQNIPSFKLEELKRSIQNSVLWEISCLFSSVTFLLYTDKQVKQYEKSEERIVWANKYFDLLEPYNEFGYFKRENFSILLDSKENFDTKYQSNWHYYYK
ncbi:MAG: hypothetical protein ACO1O6_13790 [Bacteroidota bacterium]